MTTARWTRYVAVGDSITEGLCDPVPGEAPSAEPEHWFGWADRLAVILDRNAKINGGGIQFANLAVRGRRVHDVIDDQVPAAIELGADLVSIMVGGNDLLYPTADPDVLAAKVEEGVASLRAAGVDVLLATCFDPQFAFFLKPLRGRAAVFNANMWSIARAHSTFTLDLWGIREFMNRGMWSEDRIHLTSAGHRLLASRAAHALGVAYFELPQQATQRPELPSSPAHNLSAANWLMRYGLPWVGRRLRGTSSGDGRPPKVPSPVPVSARQHTHPRTINPAR